MLKMNTEDYNKTVTHWKEIRGLQIGSIWKHYKGGIYVIDGFGIETHHGGLLVRYHRIGGPNFDAVAEIAQEFYRPPEEWWERVKIDGGSVSRYRFSPFSSVEVDRP